MAAVAIFYARLVVVDGRPAPVAFMEHYVITAFVAGDASITGRRRVVAADAMRWPHAGRRPSGVMRPWAVLGMA